MVKEIKGDNRVSSVVVENVKTEVSGVKFGGVFIYVGLDPVSRFAKDLGITNEAGWIVTDNHMETAISGIYAIGMFAKKTFAK